ncbi:hypothetical protein AKJ58_00930 [candidate division MSBL1 archaeon SCGC-AAA385D11]|uniref:Peptidase M10 metallopeptidase domain-containing protein n=1 Tax=candidate division MSBL1 archaeon SCGC-AAA385D11 TaxID=1698286 RepID=A0A133VNR7_9EURY|nr:hypothetical protein AKJ58_00930 [candidate division MSBL1 archaeon SCGC-AAA385D11]
MLSNSQAGVATAAVMVAIVAVVSGAVGTPIIVDEIDVQPDSPLYGLERAGEKIKEITLAGGQNWQLDRARERTEEYLSIVEKRIVRNHVELLDDSGERLSNAIESAEDKKGLEEAREVIDWHIRVLENLQGKENLPDVAKTAISLAISRSAKGEIVLADVISGELPSGRLSESVREEIRSQVESVREKARSLKDEIKENLGKGASVHELVQNIEIGTAGELRRKFVEMAEKGKAEEYTDLIEEAQNRFNVAARNAEDNVGLRRALEAIRNHIRVLENVKEKVPDAARPAISRALVRSSWQERVLENIENKLEEGRVPPGLIKEELENEGVALENLMTRLENLGLPPGILKEILENREIPLEDLKEFLEERRLPRGILKEILENRGISPENLVGILENDWLPFVHERGQLPGWVPGPPPWAGPEERLGGEHEETEEEGQGYRLLNGIRIQSPPANYSINPTNDYGLDENALTREISEAFETWGAQTSVELFDDNILTTDKSGFQEDGDNVISFAPLEETGVAAETRIWYDEETKNVLEFDIVLNSTVEWGIDPDGEGPEKISAFDVRNIVTHEAGHTLILLDITDEDYAHLTMYHQSEPGSTLKISLENGDIEGLHELYGE